MSEPSRQSRILLVGPSVEVVRAAGAAGFRVWSLCDAGRCPPGGQLADLSERLMVVDFRDEAALGEAVGVAEKAGLCVNPAGAVRLLGDVAAVRRAGGVNGLARVGGSGGGELFRVDTLSVHGMHRVVGISVETPYGVLFPAPVGGGVAATLRSAVGSLLDLAGYQYGPAHTFVVLTPRGPVTTGCRTVVAEEVVAGLVRVAAGRDPVRDAFEVLAGRDVAPVRAGRYAVAVAVSGGWGQVVLGAESAEGALELAGRVGELAG
ncbi:hypothetical protein [Streptomyces acidiscabies]|uniref:hypothetical protein n=1 Tax=Streptomyces acidiscabies TaxID=42234 RepID=UPI00073E3DE1|nr:hypothetical protein [Streptomyces acidiscabies]GAQ58607.1 hypothetical protein a10_08498 [Streptomyces acidiscabies]GAV45441.1 hypothetical protein Saa2_08429 [Streptomyces acidiscabies]